jgi:hypothetical protein
MTGYIISVLAIAFGLLSLNLLTTRKKKPTQEHFDFPADTEAHHRYASQKDGERRGAAMSGVR